MKVFLATFITIFLAELGDKTQIATMLFSADKEHGKLTIFLGAATALILCSAIGVLLGGAITNYLSERNLKLIGGIGFLIMGFWTIFSK